VTCAPLYRAVLHKVQTPCSSSEQMRAHVLAHIQTKFEAFLKLFWSGFNSPSGTL
jgi:hypothetical protein